MPKYNYSKFMPLDKVISCGNRVLFLNIKNTPLKAIDLWT
jgi:hypothetical protein